VACPKEKFWVRLTEAIARPDIAHDPRFPDFSARSDHEEELVTLLDSVFKTRPAMARVEDLRRAGVPTGQVQDMATAPTDPQTTARGLVVETDHPRFGTVRQVAGPVRVGSGAVEHQPAPRRNQHADEILGGLLGYDEAARSRLTVEGAFGPAPPGETPS